MTLSVKKRGPYAILILTERYPSTCHTVLEAEQITPRPTNCEPAHPTLHSYIDRKQKNETSKAQEKRRPTWRQPKSKAYIDFEEEEEWEQARPTSPAAKRYDPRTIVSDFLRAIGEHPNQSPLNTHMEGSLYK